MENENAEVKLEVTTFYDKSSKNFDSMKRRIKQLKASPKVGPDLKRFQDSMSFLIASDRNIINPIYKTDYNHEDLANGTAIYKFSNHFEDTYMVDDTDYTLNINYDWKLGWQLASEDWISTRELKLAGTYDIKWFNATTAEHPGPDSQYDVNEVMKNVVITGRVTIVRQKDKDPITNNTLFVAFTRKGKSYSIAPTFVFDPIGLLDNKFDVAYGPEFNDIFTIHCSYGGYPDASSNLWVINSDNYGASFTRMK